MRGALVVVLVLARTSSADDGRRRTAAAPPPVSGIRVVGEALLGSAFGALGLGLGYAIGGGDDFIGCSDVDCDFGSTAIAMYAGYTVAMPLGVYLVGTLGDQTTSPAWTYAGAGFGAVAGTVVLLATDADSGGSIAFALGAPLASSVLAATLARWYDDTQRVFFAPSVSSEQVLVTAGAAF